MSPRDNDSRSAREIARSKQRKAGDRSAKLANELMKLGAPGIKKLEIDDDLREVLTRARLVTSHIARRRAERTLAGELRRFDLVALAEQMAKLHESGNADAQYFHIAEQWRARMIEEGIAVLAGFPGGDDEEWPRLIAAARRERDTGKPPGAARALFRHVVEALKVERRNADAAAEAGDTDDAESDSSAEAESAESAESK